MTKLSEKRLFLLDMDGTIYLSETLFDGSLDFLHYVRAHGGQYLFLTNNSSRGTDAYIQKLARLGIASKPEDFLTSVDATVVHLLKTAPDALYYVCGTESLKSQLRAAGLRVSDTLCDDISVLLLGYDTELTYRKIEDCCILLGRGVEYIATHPDPVCPAWYGLAPDCGSLIEMLHTATGRRPKIIGKPQPEMIYLALERTRLPKEAACIVGDRIYTDIASGANAGIDTLLVLSGEAKEEDLPTAQPQPTFVLPDVQALLRTLET